VSNAHRGLRSHKELDYAVEYIVAKQAITLPDGSTKAIGEPVDLAAFGYRKALILVNRRFLVHPTYLARYAEKAAAQGGGSVNMPSEATVRRDAERGAEDPSGDGDVPEGEKSQTTEQDTTDDSSTVAQPPGDVDSPPAPAGTGEPEAPEPPASTVATTADTKTKTGKGKGGR